MKQTKEQLVSMFAQASSEHHQALVTGDHKKANRSAEEEWSAFDQLKEMGDAGREALMPLLRHQDKAVALAAAARLLRYATTAATAVLKKISEDPGVLGFRAGQALERWQEGDWHLDE